MSLSIVQAALAQIPSEQCRGWCEQNVWQPYRQNVCGGGNLTGNEPCVSDGRKLEYACYTDCKAGLIPKKPSTSMQDQQHAPGPQPNPKPQPQKSQQIPSPTSRDDNSFASYFDAPVGTPKWCQARCSKEENPACNRKCENDPYHKWPSERLKTAYSADCVVGSNQMVQYIPIGNSTYTKYTMNFTNRCGRSVIITIHLNNGGPSYLELPKGGSRNYYCTDRLSVNMDCQGVKAFEL
jgi:hypothetical protein